jgi:hypothetical protein
VTGDRRRARRTVALLASLALLAPVAAAAASPRAAAQQGTPRVECRLERDRCYEGETLSYVVFARDVDGAEAPDRIEHEIDQRGLGGDLVVARGFRRQGREQRHARNGEQISESGGHCLEIARSSEVVGLATATRRQEASWAVEF